MKKSLFAVICLALAFAFDANAQYDKDVFTWRGRQAISEGRYSEAIRNFNVLASLDTTDYQTYFFRGIAKYNLGDLRGAQADFNTSVRLDPVFTDGYHYRAITYSRFGKYDEALADLGTAINLRPGFMGLYYTRGVTYFLAQNFQSAVDDFDRYIRREPEDASAYLNRGAAVLFLGDTLRALEDYNTAIRLDRFDPEGYIRRGRVYALQERYEEAIGDLDRAIELDTTNTFAYFNRALLHSEVLDYNRAMADLNRVLEDEPGNALTLYNRSLISAQVGNFRDALDDMDRVISINPNNVLAYFNRAGFFIQMERWKDALSDYDKAIELYPDFAKAYLNRSYVKDRMGRHRDAERDYDTAQRKVREYRAGMSSDEGMLSDTTARYNSLIALDADFAKHDFDDELLQHRDVDIRLKPLFKFELTRERGGANFALSNRFEHPLMDKFMRESSLPVDISGAAHPSDVPKVTGMETFLYGNTIADKAETDFLRGLYNLQDKQYTSALSYFDKALDFEDSGRYQQLYKGFVYMNRGALRAEMIDFIASMQNNVQTLTMDDKGTARTRVSDGSMHSYDYSEAVEDMEAAAAVLPDVPYVFFNLGNLYCLSSRLVESIDSYNKAIELYPYMGEAFFNRGLVLIYLKDKEKGCIDLSRAGELGVADSYSVISRYCEENRE